MKIKFPRVFRIFLLVMVLFGLLSVEALPGLAATGTVDPYNIYVSNFEGWGTSLAWFANVIGGWSDANRNAIADRLFAASGLGLNIVRYNIGGSSSSQQGMRPGGLVRSYLNQNGVYDWNLDANQRWMLSAAKNRGANIFEAFSNSPPWFMTISGDARGASGCGNNLQSSQYDAFADYLTEVVRHFRDSWGTTFRTLNPLNEPNATWWCITGRQEGAHFDRNLQDQILTKVGQQLAAKGLTGTSVSAPDETSPGETIGSVNAYSSTTRNFISQINTHTYGGNATDKTNVRNLAASLNKRLWMSEIDGSAGTHNHNGIAAGMWLAARVTEDINFIRPAAWVYWQVVEDESNMVSENQNWGLIHADMAGSSQTHSLTKKYYVMANYTKYIRPGYQIISAGVPNTVAAFNPTTNTLVLVTYNNTTSNVSNTFNLTTFATVGATAAQFRTSASENLASIGNVTISNKMLTATAAANSVTTYVISGVTKGAAPTYYRITNRNSNKVADVSGGSTADGGNVIQWTWNGGNNQQWQFQDAGSGYYTIVNRNSGKCLDVSGQSTADGGNVIQWTCNGGTNQQWQMVAVGSYFQLRARHSGKCMDVSNSSTADGGDIIQWTCGSGNNQQWSRQ